jgi:hypothetical protein
MFWRLGYQSTSTLDALVQRENPQATVEELLDEGEVLSEVKAGNLRWVVFLVSSLSGLFSFSGCCFFGRLCRGFVLRVDLVARPAWWSVGVVRVVAAN